MANGEIGDGPEPDAGSVRQPLPPEVPAPRMELPGPETSTGASVEETGVPPAPGPEAPEPEGGPEPELEWWQLPAQPPGPPPPPVPPPPTTPPPGTGAGGGADPGHAARQPQWHWDETRNEWVETPAAPGHMLHTAHEIGQEIGVTIGETVAAHLPNPHAAAQKRGLDIRWMRLKYNVPGLLIATLVTWGDDSLAEAVARSLAEGGPLALLGWPLMFFLVIGLLMVTPIGGALGGVLMEAIRAVLQGIGRLIARFWRVQYTGYLLRLVVAVVAWSVVIALVRLIGRAVIHFLTGA